MIPDDDGGVGALSHAFAFGDDIWPGLAKLNEECGEVIQVADKLERHTPSTYSQAIEAAAKVAAFARRSRHDMATDPDHYWQHLGEETQRLELDAARAVATVLSPPQPIDRAGRAKAKWQGCANCVSAWCAVHRECAHPAVDTDNGLAGDDLLYLVRLADWAAGQGFCQIEGIEDPEEWCFRKWQEVGPPSGDGYTPEALAERLTRIDARLATKESDHG
jgi:hypothetical protein